MNAERYGKELAPSRQYTDEFKLEAVRLADWTEFSLVKKGRRMNLKHKARFWTVIAGPLLLPISAAVLVLILSSGGAYIAANSPEKVGERALRVSVTALAEFASQATVFHPQ
jgi:hypothetical protein